MSKELRAMMTVSDGVVLLGTVAIVGVVAVASIALVYDRGLFVKGTKSEVQLQTGKTLGERVEDEKLP